MSDGSGVVLNQFRGTYTVTEENGVRTLTCDCGRKRYTSCSDGDQIVFSAPGVAPCFVRFIQAVTKKRQAVPGAAVGGVALFPGVAAAQGDPHITGPNGEKFEFNGKRAAVYTLFASPQVCVLRR